MTEITRFEVIDPEGRAVVHYAPVRMEVQDEGRTLKVFLDRPLKLAPAHLSTDEEHDAVERMARAICLKEHEARTGMDSPEESWASWHSRYEAFAEQALAALLEKYELRRKG